MIKSKLIQELNKFFWVLIFLFISHIGIAQNNNYHLYLKNISQTDPKNLTFEIWAENTGTSPLYFKGFQAGIDFNYNGLANNGVISASYDPASFDLASYDMPGCFIDPLSKQIRITNFLMDIGLPSYPLIPTSGSGGVRIVKIKLTNTNNFSQGFPNFVWSYLPSSSSKTQTYFFSISSPNSEPQNITNSANQSVVGNPTINATVPTLPEWGLIVFSISLLFIGILYIRKI